MTIAHLLARCAREEDGSEVVEYVLLLGLIVLGAIALISSLGVKVADTWRQIVDAV